MTTATAPSSSWISTFLLIRHPHRCISTNSGLTCDCSIMPLLTWRTPFTSTRSFCPQKYLECAFRSVARLGALFISDRRLQSLSADQARLRSSEGAITGNFTVKNSLHITTNKAPIVTNINMINSGEDKATNVTLTTSNRYA